MRKLIARGTAAALLSALLCLAVGAPEAIAQNAAARARLDAATSLWRTGSYGVAYTRLKTYRAEPYGRTAQVDYMIGTSACRVSGLAPAGRDLLKAMLTSYSLTTLSKSMIRREINKCETGEADRPQVLAGMTTHNAKSYFWLNSRHPIENRPMSTIRDIDPSVFDARLTQLGDERTAANKALAGAPGCQILVGRRVVICSRSPGMDEASRARALEQIEAFITWVEQAFAVTLPDEYITVFVVPSVPHLRQFADGRHGLRVSPSTIGYAFRDDLSLTVVTPSGKMGTALHELFHLLIRRDFGDIPQWLDEGIASLYEVSNRCGDGVIGVGNWRGELLRQSWPADLTLQSVIASPWFGEAAPLGTTDAQRIAWEARMLAVGRYLMLYLQDNGHLAEVLAEMQKRPIEADPAAFAEQVITQVTGQTLGEVEQAVRLRVTNDQDPSPPAWVTTVITKFGGRTCQPAAIEAVEKYLPPGGGH